MIRKVTRKSSDIVTWENIQLVDNQTGHLTKITPFCPTCIYWLTKPKPNQKNKLSWPADQ